MSRVQIYTAKKKRWHRKRYDNRFKNGLCPMCGRERTGEWIICETCREKSRTYQKTRPSGYSTKGINKYRIRCRREGICYGCGRYIGLGKYKRCKSCREKDRIAHAERYMSG